MAPRIPLVPGDVVDPHLLDVVDGPPIHLPDLDSVVHLQFRRFAGCPVCNLHLRSMVRRHDEIRAAGVREVVVFHSTAAALLPHVHDLPFDVVPDPDKRLYVEFGVESSPRALLDPRAWPTIVRGVVASAWAWLRGRQPLPTLRPAGGRYGLPADLLIGPDGTVLAAHHGVHADDQWTVDDLLAAAASAAAAGDEGASAGGGQPVLARADAP